MQKFLEDSLYEACNAGVACATPAMVVFKVPTNDKDIKEDDTGKPTEKFRIVQNLKIVNDCSVRDVYPLPRIAAMLEDIAKRRRFSVFDFTKAFFLIPILDRKTAEACSMLAHTGVFIPRRMPQGHRNAPSTQQRTVELDAAFRPAAQKGYLYTYLDDNTIATGNGDINSNTEEDFEYIMSKVGVAARNGDGSYCFGDSSSTVFDEIFRSHAFHVARFFALVRKWRFILCPKKTILNAIEITLLGYLVNARGLCVDKKRASGFLSWKRPVVWIEWDEREVDEREAPRSIDPDPECMGRPVNIRRLRALLGSVGYHHCLIKDFAKVTFELREVTKPVQDGEDPHSWNEPQDVAFVELFTIVTSEPYLARINEDYKLLVESDWSIKGIGASLYQISNWSDHVGDDGFLVSAFEKDFKREPIQHISRSCSKTEKDYDARHGECLAFYWGITKFRVYLFGKKFNVLTDHDSLRYLKECNSHKIGRWRVSLQQFEYSVAFRKGRENIVNDGLSRNPNKRESNKDGRTTESQVNILDF